MGAHFRGLRPGAQCLSTAALKHTQGGFKGDEILHERRGNLTWRSALSGIDRAQLALLSTLLIAVALFGGSSRYDAMQNVLMQPLAWLVAGFALVKAGPGAFGAKGALPELRWPLVMLVALAALALAQLVPLGHELWSALPGRQPLADIAAATGSDGARPLSMAPSRTLNALASLGIPFAALLVMAAIGRKAAYAVLVAIVLLAAANAGLALLQIASGYADAGYLYTITNEGAPVGIFANRNHSAVFGALAMLVIGFLVTRAQRRRLAGADIVLWSIYAAIFLTILVNGSRAGLLTTGIALLATAVMVLDRQAKSAPASAPGAARSARIKALAPYLPAAVIVLFAVGLTAVFLLADRLTAFQRIVESNPLEDLRFQILPVLLEMIGRYFPLGTGLGTFEQVYRIHEPAELLGPRYLNMAHNDWLQWPIETGLPGIIVLLAFLGWLGWQVLRLRSLGRDYLVFALGGFAIIAIASYFDYPLRTPLFQVAGVWFVCALALLGRDSAADGATDAVTSQ